jgi:hypothetical protein
MLDCRWRCNLRALVLLLSDSLYWIGYRPVAARVIQMDTVAPHKALGISRYLKLTLLLIVLRLLNDLLD